MAGGEVGRPEAEAALSKKQAKELRSKLDSSVLDNIGTQADGVAEKVKIAIAKMTELKAGDVEKLISLVSEVFDLFGNPAPKSDARLTKEYAVAQIRGEQLTFLLSGSNVSAGYSRCCRLCIRPSHPQAVWHGLPRCKS